MCRLGVYRGKPITLKRLIFDPPHNFVEQARQPREMVITPINVDGYGIGWYNREISKEPAIMKSEKPFWHDMNVSSISGKIKSDTIFMHVRAASPGLLVHQANSHPFQMKHEMFMHNGIISDFKKGYMRSMRQLMSDDVYSHILGTTDSEHIFGLYLTLRQINPSLSISQAIRETVDRLNYLAQKHNSDLILNLAVTDGLTTVVTKYTTVDKAATLYYTDSSPFFPDAVVVSSEPLDHSDTTWKSFPMNHMMEINQDGMHTLTPLDNPFVKEGEFPPAKPITLKVTFPSEDE